MWTAKEATEQMARRKNTAKNSESADKYLKLTDNNRKVYIP